MSKLSYLIELTIKDGQDAFKEKAAGDVAAVEADERGTLVYEWHVAEDGSRCLLHEAFDSSESLPAHLAHVGPSLPDLLAIAPITRFEVMGSASDARAALADFGTVPPVSPASLARPAVSFPLPDYFPKRLPPVFAVKWRATLVHLVCSSRGLVFG